MLTRHDLKAVTAASLYTPDAPLNLVQITPVESNVVRVAASSCDRQDRDVPFDTILISRGDDFILHLSPSPFRTSRTGCDPIPSSRSVPRPLASVRRTDRVLRVPQSFRFRA